MKHTKRDRHALIVQSGNNKLTALGIPAIIAVIYLAAQAAYVLLHF